MNPMSDIWRHAVDTFGDEGRVRQWMNQSLEELGGQTPGEAVLSGKGEQVEAILSRIDYGVIG